MYFIFAMISSGISDHMAILFEATPNHRPPNNVKEGEILVTLLWSIHNVYMHSISMPQLTSYF